MTMETKQNDSGLWVPAKPPEKPQRRYGPLEVQDEENRVKTKEALCLLWDALELSGPFNGIPIHSGAVSASRLHLKAYCDFAEMLLGEDQPEHEVWT